MSESKLKATRPINKFIDQIATQILWFLGISSLLLVGWLLYTILSKGLPYITGEFLIKLPEEFDAGGGIGPVLFNSIYVLVLSMILSIPISIAAGIYLAEYAPDNRLTAVIRLCVEGLASGSIVVRGYEV